jgi:hypothetical protein
VAFFTTHSGDRTWDEVIRTFCGVLSAYGRFIGTKTPAIFPYPGKPFAVAVVITFIQGVGLVVAYCWAKRQKRDFWTLLVLFAGLLSLSILTSLKRVTGPLYEYFILWMTIVGVLSWIIIGGVFSPLIYAKVSTYFGNKVAQPVKWLTIILMSLLLGVNTHGNTRRTFLLTTQAIQHSKHYHTYTKDFAQLSTDIKEFLHSRNIRTCYLRKGDGIAVVPAMAGIILELAKTGIAAFVDPEWSIEFPSPYLLSSRPEGTLWFLTPETGKFVLSKYPDFHLVSDTNAYAVVWQSIPVNQPLIAFSFADISVFALKYRGFHEAESFPGSQDTFRWSSGKRSTFLMPLEDGYAYQMRFVALPFVIPGAQQTITIFCNGQEAQTISLPPEWRWHEYTVELPQNLVKDLNSITFRYKYNASPNDLGVSQDTRSLAVGFKSIRFEKHLFNFL